ncbi:MAG: ABC transporter substrate-binding protein [Proteobacteria bacterium]|nr:ABC transporter substrate-binding protein [Pseudomonadota bacterium]
MAGAALLGLCGAWAAAPAAQAADPLTLQLKWVTQGQFVGYYVALAKGVYKADGLNVTIKPGGPDINPDQVLAGGGADVVIDWMPSALATREKGVAIVNIAQVFQHSGMELTCRRDSGIRTPADFKGKTLGVWFSGNEYPFLSWMAKLGYSTDGAHPDVTVLKQGFNVDPLLQKQAACISTMTYNEYWQLIEAGMKPSQLIVFKYQAEHVATLEDGLYVLQRSLDNPAMVGKLARFLKASKEGWQYAEAHQAEAVKILLAADTAGVLTKQHQTRMVEEVVKLLGTTPWGYLQPADYKQTVSELLSSKSTPVISKAPAGAYSYAVWDKAFKK